MRMERGDRFSAVADFVDDSAGKCVLENVAQAAADDRMIVDQHHAQRGGSRLCLAQGSVRRCGRHAFSSGNVSSTRVPWPVRLVMRSVPPSLRARSLIPISPSDRPFSRRPGMPTPLSLTYSTNRPRLLVPTVVEMRLARDAGPLFLAHLLEALGQCRVQFLVRRQRKLAAA